jgi:SAM-dependent methyltransferase
MRNFIKNFLFGGSPAGEEPQDKGQDLPDGDTDISSDNVIDEHYIDLSGFNLDYYIKKKDEAGLHHIIRYMWAIKVIASRQNLNRIIDVACGSGYGTYELAKNFPKKLVLGYDYDDKALEYARNRYRLPNLVYRKGDVTQWCKTIGNDKFDCIISFDTIEHISHREIMMENIVDVMSDRGMLLFSTPLAWDGDHLLPSWEHHKIEYSPASLYDFLSRYFRVILRPEDDLFPCLDTFDMMEGSGYQYLLRMNPVVCEAPIKILNPYYSGRGAEENIPEPEHKKTEKELIFDNLFTYLERYSPIPHDAVMLEVGVGPDGFVQLYSKKAGHFIGLDVTDYSDKYEDIDYIVYDGLTIPLANDSVDIVVSHSVLEHVADVSKTLSEINRILKVGGMVYITISPLYYSSWGNHMTLDDCTTKLDNWQHLDPSFAHYLTEDPMALHVSTDLPDSETEGHSLNKLTVSEFLEKVGTLPWSIIRFDRYFENKAIPDFLEDSDFAMADVLNNEFRFIATKVCNFSDGRPVYE